MVLVNTIITNGIISGTHTYDRGQNVLGLYEKETNALKFSNRLDWKWEQEYRVDFKFWHKFNPIKHQILRCFWLSGIFFR